jgi:cytochrome oxidase Cu insertion factor (SCO1/SenC/PrrC family)
MNSRIAASLLLLALMAPASALASSPEGDTAHTQHAPAQASQKQASAARLYACPMHPEVKAAFDGKCHKCGMSLKEVNATAPRVETAASVAGREKTLAETSASYFPNVELLTQDGRPVRLYDDLLKGKVVIINFMFTTCTGVCPPMTANLAKVQSYLGERVGREVVIISISVDPAADTPVTLKKYADGFKARPGWYFLTGKKENVDWALYKLGGYVEDKMQHSGLVIIGNETTGEWVKTSAMRSPAQIAEAVLVLLKSNEKQK